MPPTSLSTAIDAVQLKVAAKQKKSTTSVIAKCSIIYQWILQIWSSCSIRRFPQNTWKESTEKERNPISILRAYCLRCLQKTVRVRATSRKLNSSRRPSLSQERCQVDRAILYHSAKAQTKVRMSSRCSRSARTVMLTTYLQTLQLSRRRLHLKTMILRRLQIPRLCWA